ncbi:hypothetical protein [Pseudomonas aeruginosa]|nr:hypothetical protein [Pseudomonas aeruginosa]
MDPDYFEDNKVGDFEKEYDSLINSGDGFDFKEEDLMDDEYPF